MDHKRVFCRREPAVAFINVLGKQGLNFDEAFTEDVDGKMAIMVPGDVQGRISPEDGEVLVILKVAAAKIIYTAKPLQKAISSYLKVSRTRRSEELVF